MKPSTRCIGRAGAALVWLVLACSPTAHAADPVRGKLLYETSNGAPLACAASGCHGTSIALNRNKIARGANNGPLIMSAIARNTGAMGYLSAYISATDADDIGAYIANPAAGTATPAASVSPPSLAFAATVVGALSANQAVTLSNPGSAPLSIASLATTGANAQDFAIAPGASCASGLSLAPGASCSVQLRFEPTAAGARSAALTIGHNASGSSSNVALSGTATIATQPSIAVSSNSLSFPATALGTASATQSLTVRNAGGASLAFTGFSVSGPQAGEFARAPGAAGGSCATGTPLAPGASCTIGIGFAPMALGTRAALLTIASDAANGSPAISLGGTGSPAPAPLAQLSPVSIAFGDQSIGTASPTRRVLLTNAGDAPLAIASVSTVGSAGFAIVGNACATTLAAGAGCAIDVAFVPSQVGTATAELRIADDAAGSPHAVALSANGVAGPSGSPTLSPTAAADFGEVEVGQRSVARSLLVGNAGNAAFAIAAIAIAGADASSFIVEPGGCAVGAPIAPAGACSVAIAFAPAAVGARAARLEIATHTGAQLSVELRGAGLAIAAPAIDTGSGALDFGVQPLHGSATRTLTLTNIGTALLEVGAVTVTGPFGIDPATSLCPAAPFALNPGASCQLAIAFTPTATGDQGGVLSIVSNAGPTPRSVALTAKAEAAGLAAPANLGYGGCTSGRSGPADPSLALLAGGSAVALGIRRRPRRSSSQHPTGEQR